MSSLTSLIDLNDADVLRIESVVKILNDRQGKVLNLDAFAREAVERFADVGFRARVNTYDTNQQGLYAFEIEINDRLEGEFDPDQMVYEATNDVLELGTGGVIKSGPVRAAEEKKQSKLWTPDGHGH